MLIPVIYPNGKHDLVKDFILSKLIDDHEILKFKRSNGWVNASADNIRTGSSISLYSGEERRESELETAEIIEIF
ncbi:MAG: hypothetical protein QNK27_04820 [Desulfuromusa sp.]|nr:hypothetical protein [Desulfuromusa sp.]